MHERGILVELCHVTYISIYANFNLLYIIIFNDGSLFVFGVMAFEFFCTALKLIYLCWPQAQSTLIN